MQKKRAIICANGEQPDHAALRRLPQPGDYRIAADGGLHHWDALGLEPHLLIGDMDSVSAEEVDRVGRAGGRVVRFPVHKDETDLELALLAAALEGYQEIVILGALGGRLDMTLGNISLLLLPELANCTVRLDDGIEEVFFIHPGSAGRSIDGQRGDRVSLLPWGGPASGILTEGLYYPLRGETLYPERTRGISNEMLEAQARVAFETGLLLCIHTRLG